MHEYRIHKPSQFSESPPLLVLLHGVGSNELDLLSLASEFDPRLVTVTLRAPYVYGPGFAWYRVDFTEAGRIFSEVEVQDSLDQLVRTLESLPGEVGADPHRLIVGGFSQGAIMSLGISLLKPELASAVLMMSGRMMPQFEAIRETPKSPYLLQHGLYDPVITIDEGREAYRFLKARGADVEFLQYPMEHQISAESLGDARHFVARTLYKTRVKLHE